MLPRIVGDGIELVRIDRSTRLIATARLVTPRVAAMLAGLLLAALGAWLARAAPPRRLVALLDDAAVFSAQVGASLRDAFGNATGEQKAALALLVLMAIATRAPFMVLPLGYDESITYVYFASRGLIDIVTDYAIPNNQVLHTLLVRLSVDLLGDSPLAVRLPAFLAGMLLVPATFWLVHRLFGRNSALLASAIVAVSPALVEYSAQARGYTMLALALVLGFAIATLLGDRSTVTGWLAFAAVFALGFFTVPTMAFGYGVVCAWLLLSAPRERRLRLGGELAAATAVMVAVVAVLYVPIILRSGLDSLLGNRYVVALPWRAFLSRNAHNAGALATCWTSPAPGVIGPLLGAGVVAAIGASRRPGAPAAALLLALGWIALLAAVQRVAPPPRTLHMLLPLAAGLAACGLAALYRIVRRREPGREWPIAIVVLAAVWAISQPIAHAAIIRGGMVPGQVGSNFCSEGYFVDGGLIVARLRPELAAGRVLVAEQSSGIIESVQYEMLRAGFPPTLAYAQARGSAPGPLAGTDHFYVALNRSHLGRDSSPRDVADMFGQDPRAFAELFESPLLIARLDISDLYRVDRRTPPDDPPAHPVRIRYPI